MQKVIENDKADYEDDVFFYITTCSGCGYNIQISMVSRGEHDNVKSEVMCSRCGANTYLRYFWVHYGLICVTDEVEI